LAVLRGVDLALRARALVARATLARRKRQRGYRDQHAAA
jgi:predicted DNA-binding WGR domain protein